jgi:energy-coupling factor transporter ATP-binding protein EcfA2
VLLTGISGSGKSTVLWAVAFLWRLMDQGLPAREEWPEGDLAMHITGLDGGELLAGWSRDEAFREDIKKRHPNIRAFFADKHSPNALAGAANLDAPNMILLDADFHIARQEKDFENAWFLTDDDVKDDWPEALSRLYKGNKPCAGEVLTAINRLLVDKKLAITSAGSVQVHLGSSAAHGPQQLSMGERHIAVLCFCAACCLKQGGVLLLDEPAVHLHPSQVMGLLSTLEHFCRKAQGQILLVSHNPAIWQRYQELGLTVELEACHDCK